MSHKQQAERLASHLDCELEVNYRSRHVTIWLPEGKQVAGNPGLDCLCNDGESMAEVWPLVVLDLQNLEIEPIED